MALSYLVVGGGIAGASVAYHLAEEGASVTVLEQGTLAGETTGKSGGIYGLYGTPTQYRMKQYGLELYNDFLETGKVGQQYDRLGHLEVATTADGTQRVGDRLAPDSEMTPLSERTDGEHLRQRMLCPFLDETVIETALHIPNIGAFDGSTLTREFAHRAEQHGATIETGAGVTDVQTKDGAVVGVEHDEEFIAADHVILAAGPWNARLASLADVDLPIGHSRAPILVLDPDIGNNYTIPYVNHVESGVYCIGRDDGTVLVGCHTGGEATSQIDPDSQTDVVQEPLRDRMLSAIATLFPSFADAPIVDEWVGLRSVTPDSHPIIGRTGREGLSVVAFHSSGIQLAPAAGQIVATQLVAGQRTEYYDRVSITRFDGYDVETTL